MIDVLFLFIFVSGIILIVVVLSSRSGSGLLELFGRARLQIKFDNGWEKPEKKKTTGKQQRVPQQKYQYWLEVKNRNWRFPLEGRGVVYIGRKADCTIQLTEQGIAGQQAVIYWETDRYKINNLSSGRMRTKVNGRLITRQNLGHGNTIEMGRTRLIFRDRSKMGSVRRRKRK